MNLLLFKYCFIVPKESSTTRADRGRDQISIKALLQQKKD